MLRTISLIFALTLILTGISAQKINSYDFDVKINIKSKIVDVICEIKVDFENKDSMSFILWKNTNIQSISHGKQPFKYIFDTAAASPVMFIPNGKSLILKKPDQTRNNYTIILSYQCNMNELEKWGWSKSFNEDWIELNIYSGWFPVHWESKKYYSKIKLKIDSDYKVSGAGKIKKENGYWLIEQPWLTNDNIIFASKKLKSKLIKQNNTVIDLTYIDFSKADIDSTLAECKNMFDYYIKSFGTNDINFIRVVTIPYGKGGYGRTNFFAIKTTKFNEYTTNLIAHEMGHLWWFRANSTTWQDWLNESFAEYSMLLYYKKKHGEKKFQDKINSYKNDIKTAPPIWGINRNAPKSYASLYQKGAIILYELENMLGKEQFFRLLKMISKNKIDNTKELLALIEKKLSEDTRRWLEAQLKK